jgi:hypothetical protein
MIFKYGAMYGHEESDNLTGSPPALGEKAFDWIVNLNPD